MIDFSTFKRDQKYQHTLAFDLAQRHAAQAKIDERLKDAEKREELANEIEASGDC
jgi:antirestriction protein ArdC